MRPVPQITVGARGNGDAALQLKALVAPYPAEEMVCWLVGPRVGNVKNNDPICIRTTQRILSNLAVPAGKHASAGRREIVRERSLPWAGTPRGPVRLSLPQIRRQANRARPLAQAGDTPPI